MTYVWVTAVVGKSSHLRIYSAQVRQFLALSTISTKYVVTETLVLNGLLYLNLVDSRLKGYVEMRKV